MERKTLYDGELKNIRHKTKQVFNKQGIYPFLDDGIDGGGESTGDIPGFQIFRLWPEISVLEDNE
jgi:hypothetical protein